MALKIGLLGKKLGMTQVFADDGEAVPVTVIQTGPCHVVGTRTDERDGYTALVLGFDEKPVRLANKAEIGQVKNNGGKPQRFINEIRLPAEEVEKFTVGQVARPAGRVRGRHARSTSRAGARARATRVSSRSTT